MPISRDVIIIGDKPNETTTRKQKIILGLVAIVIIILAIAYHMLRAY
jgi:hypothetical protein